MSIFFIVKYAPDQDEGMFINWNPAMSIAGPGTDIIFLDNERIAYDISFDLPDNTTETIMVDFASEIGFLGAKGRAIDSPKRVRDSYDIFLVICQSKDYETLLKKSYKYYHSKQYFSTSINNIYNFFVHGDKHGNNGVRNTVKYLENYRSVLEYLPSDLDSFVRTKVCGFIDKIKEK